jgi:hypothetical protein
LPELRWPHHFVADDRGVVDQDVNLAVIAVDLSKECPHLFVVAVVDANRNSPAAGGSHVCGGLVDSSS